MKVVGKAPTYQRTKQLNYLRKKQRMKRQMKRMARRRKKTSLASTESRLSAFGWEWEEDVSESEKEP